ncbi:hypothetical protein ILUMI_24466 [Ignelater luminosus]|uniref:Uncharacterized protein n=1 Tax=Ignelater luminosus TaxID=2038154 RepID=A0A8K0CCH5_IGNLU|nr:hypothetical protein ILUMI_24466 [Ignelater luminosus]
MGIGKHESQVEDLIKSEKFKDIPFNGSIKFIVLPMTMLLENIIQHMNFNECNMYEGEKQLTVDHILDLMTINLLGKELVDWDATPFVNSWLNCNSRLATDTQVRQRTTKGICENRLAIWNLQ